MLYKEKQSTEITFIIYRNEGNFKDAFITFSNNPQLQYLTGSLRDRLNQLRRADWGMSTDLEAVFNLILNQAKQTWLAKTMKVCEHLTVVVLGCAWASN